MRSGDIDMRVWDIWQEKRQTDAQATALAEALARIYAEGGHGGASYLITPRSTWGTSLPGL